MKTDSHHQRVFLGRTATIVVLFLFSFFSGHQAAFSQDIMEDFADQGVRGLYKSGLKLYSAGDYENAIVTLQEAADLVKQKSVIDNNFASDLYYVLSSSYYEQGVFPYFHYRDVSYFERSIEYASLCLRVKPTYWQAYENIAKVCIKFEQYDQADYYYSLAEKVVATDSRDATYLARQRRKLANVMKLKQSKAKKTAVSGTQSSAPQQPIVNIPQFPAEPGGASQGLPAPESAK